MPIESDSNNSRAKAEDDDNDQSLQMDCRKVKTNCCAVCSDTHLPTKDHGFFFQKCVNTCLWVHGCLSEKEHGMISDKELARRFHQGAADAGMAINVALAEIWDQLPKEEQVRCRTVVANVLTEFLVQILNPLYAQHPEIMPAEMREPDRGIENT